MLRFRDFSEEALRSIAAPALVMIGDADVVRPEGAVELAKRLANARLAILPMTDHAGMTSTRCGWLVPMVEAYLEGDPG